MPDEQSHVTGLFHDREAAERAFRMMGARGGDREQMHAAPTLLLPETELTSKAAEGAGVGGAIGAAVGALLAAVATVGTSIAIPGLGLVIAGPLASALAGAGAGAAAGGLLGALVGLGIPEERVRRGAQGMRARDDFQRAWRRGSGSDLLH